MKRLYRSEVLKKLGGVCGGIAEYTDTDVSIIRLLFVAAALVTGFFPVTVTYIVAWIIVPPKSQVMAYGQRQG